MVKKTDLNPAQLETRVKLVSSLSEGGWEGTAANLLFDQGKEVHFAARMEYENTKMSLSLSFDPTVNSIYLGLYELNNEQGIELVIHTEECLDEILPILVEMKDFVSSQNYKDYIRKMIKVCPRIDTAIVDEEGEKLIPIIDDNQGT